VGQTKELEKRGSDARPHVRKPELSSIVVSPVDGEALRVGRHYLHCPRALILIVSSFSLPFKPPPPHILSYRRRSHALQAMERNNDRSWREVRSGSDFQRHEGSYRMSGLGYPHKNEDSSKPLVPYTKKENHSSQVRIREYCNLKPGTW
jgi:hypothetical protein